MPAFTTYSKRPMRVLIKVLNPDERLPTRAFEQDGAVDLRSRESAVVAPSARHTFPTGVAVAIPPGFAGLVLSRSGLAAQFGVAVLNAPGLIDSGYRGEIHVVLLNTGSNPYEVRRGDRIAQLLFVALPDFEWETVDELPHSVRSSGGMGHTGP